MGLCRRRPRRNTGFALVGLLVLFANAFPIVGNAQSDQTVTNQQELKVAVLAYRGTEHALRRWTSTMAYLSKRVPGYQFRAIPLNLPKLDQAVIEGTVDFAITNAGQFVRVGSRHGMTGLATLKSRRRQGTGPVIGAALVVRADSPYHTLDDLEDTRLGAVHPLAFGGFQIYWGEMARQGHQPELFFSDIAFADFPVDALAYWVRDKQVDAAVLPACLLETMVKEGLVKDADFRVIDVKAVEKYGCRTSTQLYPNWSFASLRSTPQAVAEKVAHALLTLPVNASPVADTTSLGWTAPMSSYDIHQLYESLDIHPWKKPWWLELKGWLAHNWQIGLGLSLVIGFIFFHHLWVQYLVQKRTKDLRSANEKLIYQQQQLEHAQRVAILGELSSDLAHELNQPLTAINSFAEGGMVRLNTPNRPPDVKGLLDKIQAEAQRGRSIIDRVRGFAQKQSPKREPVDLAILIGETVALLDHELKKHQPDLKILLPTKTLLAVVDPVEIQQLLVNIMRNGVDAMDATPGPHHLMVAATAIGEDEVEICIEDSGVGVEVAEADKLFKPFYSTKPSGLGLGMSICRRIVEAHGGTITIEAAANRGTRVLCTLTGVAHG